jgi:hypothetical protein
MSYRPSTAVLTAVAALLVAATNSPAATISSVSTFSLPGFSTGSVGPVGSTPAVNNDDDPGASPNVIPFSVFFNSPGAMETEFVLENSGGTTEYRFTQTFVNTRSAAWTGFRFELGSGTGAGFVRGGDVSFDVLNGQSTATSPVFTLVAHSAGVLEWTVGAAPLVAPFAFAIDVPDGMERVTLRQTPLLAAPVPEPATFGLAVISFLAVVLRRK